MQLEQSNYDNLSAEVETYLLNKYRDALSKGDKSSAKSCLLAARYFSVSDQDVKNEICLMATPAADKEDYLISTLRFLGQKLIDMITDATIKVKLSEIRSLVVDESELDTKFDRLMSVVETLDLKEDISDDILFSTVKQEASSDQQQPARQVSTPPPKARGRPKKTQPASVIVSLDEGVKRHKVNKSRECRIVFYSIVELMFINCSKYLKSMGNRILINVDSPLMTYITGKELNSATLAASQQSFRSKTTSQSTTEDASCLSSPSKRVKLDNMAVTQLSNSNPNLTREQEEQQVLVMLTQSHKCLEFLNSNYGVFTKLWKKFISTNNISSLNWFRKFQIDSLILAEKYNDALEILNTSTADPYSKQETSNTDSQMQVDRKPVIDQLSLQVVSVPTDNSDPSDGSINLKLRLLAQSISCCLQLADRQNTLSNINDLLSTMESIGFSTNDVPYPRKNNFIIPIREDPHKHLAFLLSDSTSLLRYCIDILGNIYKKYAYSSDVTSDATIGHAIVLSQFDWPKESDLYDHCISWIRSHKPKSATPQTLSASTKFTYPEFFLYIRNQNIIEDFMAMLNQGFTLDLKGSNSNGSGTGGSQTRSGSGSQNSTSSTKAQSAGTSTRSSKMITTRGVNKTFKEDLKVALISQMRNSTIVIPLELIAKFLQDSLIPYIGSFEE